jgi:xanthine dehydrogenase small subunit
VTIEGLNKPDGTLNPIQQAFVDAGATQCGFCTPGFIVSLTAFFLNSPQLSLEDAIDSVDGNLCRCTGHVAIREAIARLCEEYGAKVDAKKDRVEQLVAWGIVQPWMAGVQARLAEQAAPGCATGPSAETIFVAGGTDAFVQRPDALRCAKLNFLSQRPELSFIKEEGDSVAIGGGTTVEKMRRSEFLGRILPDNKHAMTLISSTIMRNRATVAGNLVNASPIADLTLMFLALGTTLDLEAADGKRRSVNLSDFYLGYKKLDLAAGELVHTLRFKKPGASAKFSFEKVAQREYLDIASVNTALLIGVEGKTISSAALSAGGIAPVPKLLIQTAAALVGKPLGPATVKAAAEVLNGEIAPIDDVRGSAHYKRLLLRQLVFAHFIKLFPNEFTLENLL